MFVSDSIWKKFDLAATLRKEHVVVPPLLHVAFRRPCSVGRRLGPPFEVRWLTRPGYGQSLLAERDNRGPVNGYRT